DDEVALLQLARLAALDRGAQPLIRTGELAANHLSTGDEGRRAVHHVEDVGLLVVHFDLSWSRAPRDVGRVVGPGPERAALHEEIGRLVALDVDDAASRGGRL